MMLVAAPLSNLPANRRPGLRVIGHEPDGPRRGSPLQSPRRLGPKLPSERLKMLGSMGADGFAWVADVPVDSLWTDMWTETSLAPLLR